MRENRLAQAAATPGNAVCSPAWLLALQKSSAARGVVYDDWSRKGSVRPMQTGSLECDITLPHSM